MTAGTKIKDNTYGSIYVVTSITDKRVNLDEPNCKYTTSTGRSSSKFYVGHARLNTYLKSGRWVIQD